jgi:hypothetical protein
MASDTESPAKWVAMSADVTTVVVAILGAVGTLSSPLLTQRIADRGKRQDFEFETKRRREDRFEDDRRSAAQERRAIYARLNTAARQYEQAIYQYLRVIAEGPPDPAQEDELVAVRETFRELYSDAQMMLPDQVLAAAMDMSYGLGQAYGKARRLERRLHLEPSGGRPADDPGETIEAAREYCHRDVYQMIIRVRGLMREDLGVSEPAGQPGGVPDA